MNSLTQEAKKRQSLNMQKKRKSAAAYALPFWAKWFWGDKMAKKAKNNQQNQSNAHNQAAQNKKGKDAQDVFESDLAGENVQNGVTSAEPQD